MTWGVLAFAVLAIWGVFRWRKQRSEQQELEEREARARNIAQRREKPTAREEARPGPRPDLPVLEVIGMRQKARDFLAALHAGAEVPGGFAFRELLQQARLDGSMASLDRVEQLLVQIRTGFAPQRESLHTQPGVDNFCCLLAFYLGDMISRQAHLPIEWHTREEAAAFMPPDMPIPEASWSRVVGIIGASTCVPLGLLEDKLFNEAGERTCRAYVERMVARFAAVSAQQEDENQHCAQLLAAFFNDDTVYGGLAFRELLKRQSLDYSLPSLTRVDQLLRSIGSDNPQDYAEFVNSSETQNFLRLLAFYTGMTVARQGGMAVKWLKFAEASKDLPELEFQFETSSVCLLGGRFYFPLGLVTEILFQPDAQRSLPEWAGKALQVAPPPLPSILRSSTQADPVAALEAPWALAVHKAGFFAAWSMFGVEGGVPGRPQVLASEHGKEQGVKEEGGQITDFGFYDSLESGLQAAQGQMDANPGQAPFQVMSFDGYANLPTGRTDALTVELRVYTAGGLAPQADFTLKVACPYRNANDPQGFAIYSPKLLECSAPAAVHAAIFKHFYLGIESFKVSEFTWAKHLDERI